MKTIWKYHMLYRDSFSIEMPKGAQFLSVQLQGDQPWAWALVNDEVEREARQFRMLETGHQVPDSGWDYVGTFKSPGWFVWHLFVQTARE